MDSSAAARQGAVHAIRIHATNITGVGATQLAQSLLPAIEQVDGYEIRTIFLPARGLLSAYEAARGSTHLVRHKRYLLNALSRVLECALFAGSFEGEGSLLVLGDIPLRCNGRQTVFVQNLLLTAGAPNSRRLGAIKYVIARTLFRINARYASAFVVQTEAIRQALAKTYPQIGGRIHVIAQPAPTWLTAAGLKRTGRVSDKGAELELFYPAAPYPHKNHRMLSRIGSHGSVRWPVSSLMLTIEQDLHPHPGLEWIKCVGHLRPEEVLRAYASTDGLLFLSLSESLGFPLLEAMSIGLPIICPELPYARVLCGDQGIYFNPADVGSLHAAVVELQEKLESGWWPDWYQAMQAIPADWATVAAAMLRITAGHGLES